MQKLSKWNKGYKYLLMVLDLFSKYGWIIPLKTKTGLEVSKNIYRIEKIIPKKGDKALVKWKGYPDEFNSWVFIKRFEKL